MNITIGQVATGDKFYIRKKLIKRLWKKIESGSNILMSAPRRIGKTSIMQYCKDKPQENFTVIYVITESVNNQNEFYKKLVKELKSIINKSDKLKSYLKDFKIESIGPKGITFENKETNYFDIFKHLAEKLDLKDCKLILMIDEFAQTVENIMQDESENSAVRFLASVRELRINPYISKNIQFIFAGSIGLENIVSQINANSTINDLYFFPVSPFSNKEALDYIKTIPLKNEEYDFAEGDIIYLLEKLEWNIPYFINIILDEIESICYDEDKEIITKTIIDQAFKNTLKKRAYFEHWHNRLRKAYKQNNYNFAKAVLNQAAESQFITKEEVVNIAVELEIQDSYKDIINSLEYDGYLYLTEGQDSYVFTSPLLKQWWFNYVTN